MDKRNGNISETFGKYNSGGEVKNVSSKNWEPISAGRSFTSSATAQPSKKTGTSPDPKKQSSAKSKKSDSKKSVAEHSFISQGNPAERKKAEPKSKAAPKNGTEKKTAPKKKNPPSRTPKGRDLRKDVREQQKDREQRFRNNEDYNEHLSRQLNHDEASEKINDGKRKKAALRNGAKVGIVIFLAVIVIAIFAMSKGAIIETVIIEGNTVYTNEEVQQVSGVYPGKSLFSFSEGRIRRELTKKLPYISNVSLKRDFPDTLTLMLEVTTDRYVIINQSGCITLDSNKKVVSESAAETKNGIYFAEGFDFQSFETGDTYRPEGINAERLALLESFADLFEKSKAVKTATIDLHNPEDVVVNVGGKVNVYFGDCKNLEEKIPYASAILVTVIKAGKTGYIDLKTELGYFKPGSMTM